VAAEAGATAPYDAAIDLLELAGAAVVVLVCAVPLALSAWALLDAAQRPEWVWALAGRRRVVWIAAILFGVLTVLVGLVVSLVYLLWVRPELADAETGRIGGRGAGGGGPNRPSGGGP
jgi:hypothetical protein